MFVTFYTKTEKEWIAGPTAVLYSKHAPYLLIVRAKDAISNTPNRVELMIIILYNNFGRQVAFCSMKIFLLLLFFILTYSKEKRSFTYKTKYYYFFF